jgi:hypothetical protein
MTYLIPARAAEDYEALREQLFGMDRPDAPAAGFSVLVRCGLAVWAQSRNDCAALPPRAPLAPVPTPAEHLNACSSLAKLIANLILSTHREMTSCRT